MTCGREGTKNV